MSDESSSATRVLRILRLSVHLARGLATAALVFPFQSRRRRNKTIQRWSARLLKILAVRLHVHGQPASRKPLMLIANHVSWLDIFVVNAIITVRFVAKAEIREWPLLGWLCLRSGTLFLQRGRRRDMTRVNDEVTAALRAGDVFAVFPEGTTTDGSTLLKFHSSLLAPALTTLAAVQPVALRFERDDQTLCTQAAYDGDKSFWDSLRGITAQRAIDAHIWFASPLSGASHDRRALAVAARDTIGLILSRAAVHNRSEPAADLRVATR